MSTRSERGQLSIIPEEEAYLTISVKLNFKLDILLWNVPMYCCTSTQVTTLVKRLNSNGFSDRLVQEYEQVCEHSRITTMRM
jgi:hypothetical protein